MADERKIHRGVRMGRETFTDVDDLEANASKEQLEALSAKGYISGFGFKGPEELAADEAKSGTKVAAKKTLKKAPKRGKVARK